MRRAADDELPSRLEQERHQQLNGRELERVKDVDWDRDVDEDHGDDRRSKTAQRSTAV